MLKYQNTGLGLLTARLVPQFNKLFCSLPLNTTGELRPEDGKMPLNRVFTQLYMRFEANKSYDFSYRQPFIPA